MIRLSERGILSRESRKLFSKKPYCEGGMGAFASVGFMESYGAFLSECFESFKTWNYNKKYCFAVMLSGLLLSCILFFLERLVLYVRKPYKLC